MPARASIAAKSDGVELAPQQQAAVRAALTHRLVVLTGGPGTGKTTTVRSILRLCRQAGHRPVPQAIPNRLFGEFHAAVPTPTRRHSWAQMAREEHRKFKLRFRDVR